MEPERTANSVKTTCPYCGVGCGVLVSRDDSGAVRVAGDPDHPANFGRLCSKGAALADTLDTDGRLLYPRYQGRRVSWDEALDTLAGRFREIIAEDGPDAVAFYVSGQLLTEDYYVANKLMKGFIGGGNIDTNSRLCMSSAVAGYKRAFGSDTVPCNYRDLEEADLIVLAGSNTAWCHPVLFQRIKQAKQDRPELQVVVVDPRRTATCELADLHLPLAPGTDALLFNGLLEYLRREDALDWQFLEDHTEGFAETFARLRTNPPTIPAVAAGCGLPEQDVADFYRRYAANERTVTLYSQGVNQWSFGTDKVNAIINCHLATGRVGRPGSGPFSITGQPNAMGGREVGGLANQLAAHMDFAPREIDRVQRFWNAERICRQPGLKAVDMFRAVEEGRIKALWIMATNPAVSMPDADRVRRALRACDFVVVSDMTGNTDTSACADLLLPVATWGEKEGTVTNSERRISRQRAFTPPPGEARPDWWILTQVARRMGFADAFPYEHPAAIFREHAALTAFENDGSRDLDLGALQGLDNPAYTELEPIQWPVPAAGKPDRPCAQGRFFTPSGKARLLPIGVLPPANQVDDDYPLDLNTGRVRDQWHTMTRTGLAPRLNAHVPEPFVQIHPLDAGLRGLTDRSLARVSTRWGSMLARVSVDADQRPGSIFIPFHWSDAQSRQARVDSLVNPATDPVSGQPEFKHTPARIESFQAAWHGFVLTRERLTLPAFDYATEVKGKGFWRYEIAALDDAPDWRTWGREALGDTGDWVEFEDPAAGRYRGARLAGGRLVGCLFIAPDHGLAGRSWLAGLFELESLNAAERASLLAGRPGSGRKDAGETICACFNVGLNSILDALAGGATTVEAIGEALKAGTNCGSCVPELTRIIERNPASKAA